MKIDNTTAANQSSAVSSSDPNANSQLGKDAFMKLLVAQLKNQDPLDPMNPRDMVTQLSQLTSVEHLMGIESRLDTLGRTSSAELNAQATSFVGKRVVADSSNLRLDGTGGTSGSFTTSSAADSTKLVIRDAAGKAVRTVTLGATGAGVQRFDWDGRSDAGARLPAGSYRFTVSASDGDGRSVPTSTRIEGNVDSVSFKPSGPALVVDGTEVSLSDVQQVVPVTNPSAK